MSSRRPLITLLTDLGSRDSYAGVLKGVIAGICPEAAVVDVTHEVPPQDIRAGAFHLLVACPYFPAGSVHLAVVDPGVGTLCWEGVSIFPFCDSRTADWQFELLQIIEQPLGALLACVDHWPMTVSVDLAQTFR